MPTIRQTVRWTRALLAAATAISVIPLAQAQQTTINVVDVGGALALLQDAISSYSASHPEVRFTFTKAPAPELPSKLKAMQAANRSDIDLVLGGNDVLSAGIDQKLWEPLLPTHAARFPALQENYLPVVRKLQELTLNQGLTVLYSYGGPMIEYNPDKVRIAPTTPAELLAWCKANPNKLIYARPANSGPARTFMMGLPYMLGDKDPKDPVNGWEKTWAYLKDLNSCIEYYPGGTGAVMKELGEGSREMTVTLTGWDINPRALGIVPKNYKISTFRNMTWVSDPQYMMMPKGVAPAKAAVVMDVMAHLLKPQQQVLAYEGKGYLYPGPVIKDLPSSKASKEAQDLLKEFGRPEYEELVAKNPHATPLDGATMVKAFQIWDRDIGAQKMK